MLFVSGLAGFASFWQDQVPAFARRFEVITFDHRGIGQSDQARHGWSVERLAADVIGLMDALRIKRAHIVGHSTGGAIAQVLAIEHPARLASVDIYKTRRPNAPILVFLHGGQWRSGRSAGAGKPRPSLRASELGRQRLIFTRPGPLEQRTIRGKQRPLERAQRPERALFEQPPLAGAPGLLLPAGHPKPIWVIALAAAKANGT